MNEVLTWSATARSEYVIDVVIGGPAAARVRTRARSKTSRVSQPWPPAFIRTAPPTDPGIPT